VLISHTKRLTVSWPDNNCSAAGCYAILQFEDIPQADERSALSELGITLHDYIPDLAYLALYQGEGVVNLPDFVAALHPLRSQNKRAEAPLPASEGPEGEATYELMATPFPTVPPAALAGELDLLGAEILQVSSQRVTFRIAAELLAQVQACSTLQFVEPVLGQALAEGIVSTNNIRVTDLRMQSGILLTGEGVQIGIQDDGAISHLDFHGRYFDRSYRDTGVHGDMVAGMAAGGGWLNPIGRGAAPGASLHMFHINENQLLTNTVDLYHRYGITITNTSYGYDCGAGYSSFARDLDAQVYQAPHLMHCFSAGNQGQNSCLNRFGVLGSTQDGTYYGNITGAMKSGKNVVAVGNVFWDDRVLLSSSRGPTPSGRIKPDFVTQGQGDWTTDRDNGYRSSSGTSAAAPNAAGGFAILYQGYRQLFGVQNPASALVKAHVLNTADDVALPGPDYSSGWGRMNVAKAWACMENEQHFAGTISHGQTQTYQLTVPAHTERVRIMLYWHDAPASVLASRDLVNDLDLKVYAPNGEARLPWAPSTVAHLDSLSLPARPCVDRVNNVEQVAWDNPAAGTYTIEVKGHQVPSVEQEFYVVYYIETEALKWVSPNAADALVPGESAVLSWDATHTTTPFRVEYSLDGGQSWQLVAANVPANRRSVRWQVPAVTTSQLRFRVLRNGQQAQSTNNGLIAPQVNFTVYGLDPQTAILNWQGVAGAVAYDIFQLGATQMVRVNRVTNQSYEVPVLHGETYWFTVAPVFPGGLVGRRAIAQEYAHTACNRQVRLQLQFDGNPEQTSWRILAANGSTLESGGPYVNQAPHSQLEESFCLPEGCHTLVMQDAAGNGMCCQNGFGSYRLLGAQGTILAEGGAFGSFRPQIFCPEEGTPSDPLAANLEIIRPISCAGQNDGILRVTAYGGTGDYRYYWSNGARSAQLENAPPGSYAVTVDDGSQAVILTTELVSPDILSLTATTLPALCDDGSLLASPQGGTPPYNLQWNTGQTNLNLVNIPAGTYFGVLTDANNCLTTARFTVGQVTPLSLNLLTTEPTCRTPGGGQIRGELSGGRGNAQWRWSTGQQGSSVLSGLRGGTYAVTVIDGGCEISATTQLADPPGFELAVASQAVSCPASADGHIEVQPSAGRAPFAYFWNDGGTGSLHDGLSPGTYQVWATDAEGCQATAEHILAAPEPMLIDPLVTSAVGTEGGSIDVSVTGGTPPYTFIWNHTSSRTNVLTDLPPGAYNLTVFDSKDCSVARTIIVDWIDPDTPIEYCEVRGVNTSYEWIAGIAVDDQHYDNGNDGGYGDYTYLRIPLTQGELHELTLKPGYRFTRYRESWRVWIDWNNDGDFDDADEEAVQEGPIIGETITNLFVPANALPGPHRMRIAMQYAAPSSPCTNLTYGEVEDYTVEVGAPQQNLRINPPAGADTPAALTDLPALSVQVWPNPVSAAANVLVDQLSLSPLFYQLKDSQGRILASQQLELDGAHLNFAVQMKAYPPGIYFLHLQSGNALTVKRLVKK